MRTDTETPIGSALLHPVAVGGLLILILNDHVLKSAYPGAVTGKVSDLAGLAFFPFFLQAAYEAWCAVRRAGPVSRSTSLWVASVITGVGFVVVEVTPIGDASYRGALGLLQWIPGAAWALVGGSTLPVLRPVVATPDPTDLAALVVLPLLNLASLRRIRRPWPMPGRARMARIERMVGAALLVIALTATVATTPAPPPESSVGGADTVAIELSADRPVAVGEIAVRLNQAALTTEVRPSALATLKLVPEKDAEGPEGRSLTSDDLADLVTISVTPTADDEPPVISAGAAPDGVLFFTHDPAWGVDTCREGEACERTYQVLLELRDVSDAPLRFNLVAEGEIHYTLPEAPVGAAIAIDAVGELETRAPVPTIHSEAQGVVELSRFEDVELHVRVTRSAGAVVQEPDAAVMLSIDELDELREEASPRVNVFLGDENRVRPENGERYQYGAEDLPRSILVVPFGSCQAGSECTVEYNIRLSLCCSSGEDFAASVSWTFTAALRYLAATELPLGAELAIEVVPEAQFEEELVQRCIGVGREIIRLAERSWNLPPAAVDNQLDALERGEWLPDMAHSDWRTICDLALAGRLDPSEPLPRETP